MGLLDSVIGALAGGGQGAGGGQADLIRVVVGMLANNGGAQAGGGVAGLGDLVSRFQQGGMGDLVASWIGTGQNLPVSGQQLNDVLGSDMIAGLARQLGMSQGDTADQLSQVLPQVVDRLTPDGQAPAGGLGDMTELLSRLAAGR